MSAPLLHLLRHGAPETPGLLMGRTDGAPAPEGIAACVARAAPLAFDAVLTSDRRRTREAAEAIGQRHAKPVIVDARWGELDFGAWDGLPPGAVDGAALGRFWSDPDAFPPPGGEGWSALTARVAAAIGALPPHPALVVTHGGAMRAALAVLCGFTLPQLWAFELPYGALLSLRLRPGDPPSAGIAGLRT